MWVNCPIAGPQTVLAAAYPFSGDDSELRGNNKQLLSCIKRHLDELRQSRGVILKRDMNVHIEDLNGHMLRIAAVAILIKGKSENACECEISAHVRDLQVAKTTHSARGMACVA